MQKHPVTVEGFDGSLEELAQKICRMRYDKVAEFFGHCVNELGEQSDVDAEKGRKQLAEKLNCVGSSIALVIAPQFERIFELCKPHMKDELASES